MTQLSGYYITGDMRRSRAGAIERVRLRIYEKGASSLFGKSAFTLHKIVYHRRKYLSTVDWW